MPVKGENQVNQFEMEAVSFQVNTERIQVSWRTFHCLFVVLLCTVSQCASCILPMRGTEPFSEVIKCTCLNI